MLMSPQIHTLNPNSQSPKALQMVTATIKLEDTHFSEGKTWRIVLLLSFSHSGMSDSLRLHGLQHTRLPCPSRSPGVCSDSCPLNGWYHPSISSCVIPFSSYLQSFPATGSFPVSQFFTSGGQSIGVSASTPVLQINIQGLFPLWLTGLISLLCKGLCRVFSSTTFWRYWFFDAQPFFSCLALTSVMITGKAIALTIQIFLGKVMSLLFKPLSRFVIAFLPKSKHLLISWLQSSSTVILEPKKIKSVTVAIVSSSVHHQVMGLDPMILVFWMLSFKPAFSLSSFTFKKLFSSLSLSAIRVVSSAYLKLLIFLLPTLIPACALSSLAFCLIYFTYKLNKQGINIQPWWTPFPIWNQSVVSCPVLTVASWPTYRFLRRQVRWSGIPISLRIFHCWLWSTQSKTLALLMK